MLAKWVLKNYSDKTIVDRVKAILIRNNIKYFDKNGGK